MARLKSTGDAVHPCGFRRKGLAQYLDRSESGIDKLVSRGELPKPIMIGRTPFWLKETIDRHLANKEAA